MKVHWKGLASTEISLSPNAKFTNWSFVETLILRMQSRNVSFAWAVEDKSVSILIHICCQDGQFMEQVFGKI